MYDFDFTGLFVMLLVVGIAIGVAGFWFISWLLSHLQIVVRWA